MTVLDWLIFFGYIIFMLAATTLFRRFASSSSNFIQGGGAMMWWMAGATAFMTQFSAWTFTGAAAKAYEDGISVMFVFWGNALGFFISARFFAARYRRLRVETSMEVIKLRFGKTSEQAFTWLSFPISLIGCSIWLNGLGSFVSAIFQIDLHLTIIMIAILVTIISVSGGAWTVSATNVIQLILLIAITMIVGLYAGYALFEQFDITKVISSSAFIGEQINYWQIFALWASTMLMQQTMSTNNSISSFRFLVTTNELDAIKAAKLAGWLFVFAPILWFSPAWLVSTLHIDLQTFYPNLGDAANNAAYLHFIISYMPKGILGLVLVAMVAATVAPMTAAINRNAGIIVRNVYQSIIRPDASEQQQLSVSKWASILSGVIGCATAISFTYIEKYSLFEIMMIFSAFIQMPLTVPSLLALICLRTPNWSGWVTIIVGLLVSAFMYFIFDINWLLPLFGEQAFSVREQTDLHIVITLLSHVVITGGFFLTTQRFYRVTPQSSDFLQRLQTPMSQQEQSIVDDRQGKYIGRLVIILSFCIAMVGAIAKPEQRMIFLLIALIIGICGYGLLKQGQKQEQVSTSSS